ncbi:sialate O-acetylesterase [Roseobacter litoralis]|uniref:sialate O-acetylesterase n=1 Tax=Roseobacter litoralis TaxID=42443 RepID=UPI0024950997|nr:sialate O-acetylesterase [Roseobacter litoralis]
MIGRADYDGGAQWPIGTIQFNRASSFVSATLPLQHNGARDGQMGLDMQFAIDYLSDKAGVRLAFIPNATGGTGFSGNQWNPGNGLYEGTVTRINAAMSANPDFIFKGFLWHQGESDAGAVAAYESALDTAITSLRSDVSVADSTTPFVLGQLGSPDSNEALINAIIDDTPARLDYIGVAPAADLAIYDAHHFTAASLRTLGSRYVLAFNEALLDVPSTASAPDQVLGVTASPGDSTVFLSWSAPPANGSPLTDYVLRRTVSGSTTIIADGTGTATSFTDTGLLNGTEYSYTVEAVNSIGAGPQSDSVLATPSVPVTPPGPTAEVDAVAHWIFGSDNTTNADLVSGQIPTGPAHTQAAGYIRSPAGTAQGLSTGLQEAAIQTVVMVSRSPSGSSLWGGTLGDGSAGNEGVSAFFQTNQNNGVFVNMRGGPWGNARVKEFGGNATDFTFVAFSINRTTSEYVLFVGNQAESGVISGSGSMPLSTRAISIGNGLLTSGAFANPTDTAEFMVFNRSFNAADLDSIYQRSRARITARGLTVL